MTTHNKSQMKPSPRLSTPVYFVTGDIGGTNSRMSLYAYNDDPNNPGEDIAKIVGAAKPTITKTFRNATQFPSESVLEQRDAFIEHIMKPFLTFCWEGNDKQVNEASDGKVEENTVKLPPINAQTKIVCCIASAGAVWQNQVRLTNLGNLLISGNDIERDESNEYMKQIVQCVIINDFVAQGYGCLTLQREEVKHLYGPDNLEKAKGPKVCVGAGTGLGECFLTQSKHIDLKEHDFPEEGDEETYTCFPSEGGHVEFSPHNPLEVELNHYLSQKFCCKHRISVERVVSGKGLANVYEFLAYKFPESVNPEVHQEFLDAGDEQGRVVAQNAKKEQDGTGCVLCQKAMSIMMTAYGYEVGSAAIKFIPTGGLFVSGGITPKNIDYIEGLNTDFMASYRNKGRVTKLLENIPLYAVMTEDLGVRGAHKAAVMAYRSYCKAEQAKQAKERRRQKQLDHLQQNPAPSKFTTVKTRKQVTTRLSFEATNTSMILGIAFSSAFLAAAMSAVVTFLVKGYWCQ